VIRPELWKCIAALSVLSFFLCVGLGCGSGGDFPAAETNNPLPVLTGISPSSATAGGAALTIAASGSSFVPSSTIEWNGSPLTTTFVSSTSLTAQIPASDLATAGTAMVTVQSPAPGGGTSSALSFSINAQPNPAPTISSLSPTSATVRGPAFTLTVTGAEFISTSQAMWNGAALPTTYISSTSLTAQVPASDLAMAGTAMITVQNPAPGGGTSSALSFTINAPPNPTPTISSLSPSSATAGGPAFTLTVSGTQFIPASQVLWNGAALATTYVSSTSLSAPIPASDLTSPGTASITVQNPAPGGGTSSALSFTVNAPPNPVPTISSLSPSSASAGGPAFTLTVSGTQFIPASQVLWNGSALATTYVSSTSLTAQVPASDLATMGMATITVENPAPGGGASSGLSFTINQPATTLTVLSVEGSDLVWDPSQQKIYVAVPAAATTNASTVTVIDPVAGSIGSSQTLDSEPYGLAISDNSQYLYAVIGGGATIQRLNLPALSPDIQWSLGENYLGNPLLAGDTQVQPGSPHTLAVSFGEYGSGSVAIFDDSVQRPLVADNAAYGILGNSLQWKADGSELYCAPTEIFDSPYYGGGSDNSLETMPVTSAGVGAVTTYPASFRAQGGRLHLDAATGYVYGDWGEVLNPANGTPIGNYAWSRTGGNLYPGALSVEDSNLNRFYTVLEIFGPGGTSAFQIQSFDQTQFRPLSTIVIPNATGYLSNFIRWGQSGLAFVTSGQASTAQGNLYILDGGFVNPSGAPDTTVGTTLDPVPTLTAISPLTATVGAESLTLTVTGRDFSGQSTLYWNGIALPTTQQNGTTLTAVVPASNLASSAQATITASNTSNAFPGSNSMQFSVNPTTPAENQVSVYSAGGNALVWDATAAKIYVSMPGIQGDSGNAIGIIDPVAGTITNSGYLGSDPANLSLSANSQYLYMALYGENSIQQLTLPNFQVNAAWNLGGIGNFDGPYFALDLQAAPENPQTTAVVLANFDISPSPAAVAIYDGDTARPNLLASQISSLQWAGNDSTLYAVDQNFPQDFSTLAVDSSGPALIHAYDQVLDTYAANIHYDPGTGLVYADGGQVIQPSNASVVGNYGASGILTPDSTLDRVFILGQTVAQTGTANYTIESFDQTKFTAIASITIPNVVGNPTGFIRWGANGLAFTTLIGNPQSFTGNGPGQLYVISGDFVKPSGNASQSPNNKSMPPVQRTWGPDAASTPRSQSLIRKPNLSTQ
jgi:hypothetical protein